MTTDVSSSYYTAAVASVPDAPPWSDAVKPYLNYLTSLQPGETWANFTDRISFMQESARRGTDLHAPIFPEDPAERGRRFWCEDGERDAFDTCFSQTRNLYPATSPFALEIYSAFVRLTPVWSTIPVNHDPNTADFIWARMRCLLSGAGHENWSPLAKLCTSLYPNCPFVPDEDNQAWLAGLVEAHKNCGFPAHLACVPWKDLISCMGQVQPSVPEEWHRAVAILHILKHVRRVEGEAVLVATYRGTVNRIDLRAGSSLMGLTPDLKLLLLGSLGCPPRATSKVSHPLTDAVGWALTKLSAGQLLTRRALRHLPGQVLYGRWTTVEPDPTANTAFCQHGTRLTGLWVASKGRVNDHTGDDDDIIGYDWNTINPTEYEAERRDFEFIKPKTYAVAFPSDIFFDAFPNLEKDPALYPDLDALKTWFDAPLFASLLRTELVELWREYPFVAFLPSTPTLDESTNQGKTLAAQVYGRAMVPTIDIVGSGDSNSAPDTRAVADTIRTNGTVCLDEWRMPRQKAHPLCRENLQLLCTGGGVISGKVLANSAPAIRLSHSIVACAKGLDFPPDMINRSIVFYLDQLTDVMRDPQREMALKSGEISLRMRLGALAITEASDLGNQLRAYIPVTAGSTYRFHAHRVLAKLLYVLRTKKPENGACDKSWLAVRTRFEHHMKDAEDTGVMASLETGVNLRLRISGFFDGMSEADVQQMKAYMDQTGFSVGAGKLAWSGTAGMIRARMAVAGLGNKPLSHVLPFISSSRGMFGDRVVVLTLNEDIRRVVPMSTAWQLPGHLGMAGWVMWRYKHADGFVVRIEKLAPGASHTLPLDMLAPGSVVLTDT